MDGEEVHHQLWMQDQRALEIEHSLAEEPRVVQTSSLEPEQELEAGLDSDAKEEVDAAMIDGEKVFIYRQAAAAVQHNGRVMDPSAVIRSNTE